MIKKILMWALAPIINECIQFALGVYHDGQARDVLNEQIEGMVGECKEHAVQTVNERVIQHQDRWERSMGDVDRRFREIEKSVRNAGDEEGDICNRDGCAGIMGYNPVEGCACHINPPCSACVDNPLVCLECGANPED